MGDSLMKRLGGYKVSPGFKNYDELGLAVFEAIEGSRRVGNGLQSFVVDNETREVVLIFKGGKVVEGPRCERQHLGESCPGCREARMNEMVTINARFGMGRILITRREQLQLSNDHGKIGMPLHVGGLACQCPDCDLVRLATGREIISEQNKPWHSEALAAAATKFRTSGIKPLGLYRDNERPTAAEVAAKTGTIGIGENQERDYDGGIGRIEAAHAVWLKEKRAAEIDSLNQGNSGTVHHRAEVKPLPLPLPLSELRFKVFLTTEEAVRYSGLPEEFLVDLAVKKHIRRGSSMTPHLYVRTELEKIDVTGCWLANPKVEGQ